MVKISAERKGGRRIERPEKAACGRRAGSAYVVAVNCTELENLRCFLSDLYNQTHGQNRG